MKARKSFFIRILLTLVLATFLEGVFFIGALNVSKSFETIEQESISLFEQRIRYRTSDIHKTLIETLNKESNYSDLLENCDHLYADRADLFHKNDVLGNKVVNDLLLLLHSRNISGAFVILDKHVFQSTTYPSIYLRDSSPDTIHNDNSDISARYGNAALLKANNLSLDANWHPAIPIDTNNPMFHFYTKPIAESSMQ